MTIQNIINFITDFEKIEPYIFPIWLIIMTIFAMLMIILLIKTIFKN